MLQHFATTTTEGSPCVAYERSNGEAVIVMECPSEERAEIEARRMNYTGAALDAMAARCAPPLHKRRPRYFADPVEVFSD